jgi:hypothetical protein
MRSVILNLVNKESGSTYIPFDLDSIKKQKKKQHGGRYRKGQAD